MMMENDEKIVRHLVDEGTIDKKKLIPIFKIHKTNQEPMEKLVVQFKLADREKVLEAKSKVIGGDPLLIDQDGIDLDLAKTIPQAMAKRYKLICFGKAADGKMIIAMHDPNDSFALEYVQMRTGVKDLEIHLALLYDLEEAWNTIYAEKKKFRHPFFKEPPKNLRKVKVIPTKLTIPGFAHREGPEISNEVKPLDKIQEAAEVLREHTEDEKCTLVIDSIQKELDALKILGRSATSLNSIMNETVVITKILETASKICSAECASISILDNETLYFKEAVGPKSDELKKLRVPLDAKSVVGWVAINKKPLFLNNTTEDERHYKGVDIKLNFETNALAAVPLMWGEEILGVMEAVNKTEGVFSEKDIEYLEILASQASVALHNAMLMEQFHNFYLEMVEILIDSLDSMETVSKEHSLKVARLTSTMAKQLNLSEDDYELLCYAAFLHDIGKIKCSDKKDIRCHAEMGAQMLSGIKFFSPMAPFIRHHHEKFDGSGVPDGLSDKDIPLGARILAIAEGYVEERSERWDLTDEEFLEKFMERFGGDYDPGLKEIFINAISE